VAYFFGPPCISRASVANRFCSHV